jgi:PAS domain S-box-containing protein
MTGDRRGSHKRAVRVTATLLAVSLFCLVTVRAQDEADRESAAGHVLVLNSYHPGHRWTDGQVAGIRKALSDYRGELEIHEEYMDTKRHLSEAYLEGYHHFLSIKYAGRRFGLVLTTDDNAYRFVLKHRRELFPATPVVFCGVNHFDPEQLRGVEGVTGIVERLDLEGNFRLAMRLHPEAREVVVITDSSATGRGNRRDIERLLTTETFPKPIRLLAAEGEMTLDEMLDAVEALPEGTIVHLVDFYRDRTGRFIDPEELMALLRARTDNPIYGTANFYMNHGIVGGKLMVAEHIGRAAGALALRILRGEAASSIPIDPDSPTKFLFDYRELQRHDVDPALLPEGSVILNKPFSFYERYRVLVWSVAGVIVGLTALSVALVVSNVRRRAAERSLRESEARFRSLAENMPVMVNAITPTGAFTYWNRMCENVTGYRREEMLNNPHGMELLYPDAAYRERLAADWEETDFRFRDKETVLRAKDGSTRITVWSNLPRAQSFSGEDCWAVGVDITERKLMEQRLRQMEKMDAIGQLAGGVAHDFNNQLSGIMGYGDVLQKRLDDPVLKKYVENMMVGARRAADLTRQLLAFSRKGQHRQTPLDVHDAIREVVEILKHSIDKRIAIRRHVDAPESTVLGDPTQIQNALLNLALNARDAMPDGGELTFRTRTVHLDGDDCRGMPHDVAPGDYVAIDVADTGCGMTEEVRRRIFEPFFTTKDIGKGTGMGLAAVYGTVNQHRGGIAVESEVGRGSTFTVWLPLTAQRSTEPEPAGDETERLEGLRVLVVDDEAMIRDMTVEILEALGCHAHAEPDGRAAVEYFREHHDEIDLAILDMIMPNMSGRDAFYAMREIDPSVKVIVASGYSTGGGAEELLAAGAKGFLQKPFQQDRLAETMRGAVEANEPVSRDPKLDLPD